jgi:phosphopantothenoylcysteine decarboxylase/phosphopantothenate--cysteine ligase
VLMAAAVADFRPARPAREKIKRGAGTLSLVLEPNPDVLATVGSARRSGQTFVGFALETSRGVARARAKLNAKRLDLIALNSPAAGIGGERNQVTLVEARTERRLPLLTKREVAEEILDRVMELRGRKRANAPGSPSIKKSGPRTGTGRAKSPKAAGKR